MKHSKFFSTSQTFLFGLLLFASITTSCHKDDLPNPYIGIWEITFDGTCVGQQTVIINDDGGFAFAVTCGDLIYSVNGQVNLTTGAMNGSVAWGPFNEPNALNGHINNNGTGSGKFGGFLGVVTGGWIAIKK